MRHNIITVFTYPYKLVRADYRATILDNVPTQTHNSVQIKPNHDQVIFNRIKCWSLRRGENLSTRGKASRKRGENGELNPGHTAAATITKITTITHTFTVIFTRHHHNYDQIKKTTIRSDRTVTNYYYSSSLDTFSSSASSFLILLNSLTLGRSSFQNAILFGLYLCSTLGLRSRTR